VVGVATEGADVVAHPVQGCHLVSQREIVVEAGTEVAELETTEDAESIRHIDDDDVAVGGQLAAVVELQLTSPIDEGAAGDPHHHRQRAPWIRRPHRQRQTGLVADLRIVAPATHEGPALRWQRPVLDGVSDPAPWRGRDGRPESPFT
jgi:hypothetical protein